MLLHKPSPKPNPKVKPQLQKPKPHLPRTEFMWTFLWLMRQTAVNLQQNNPQDHIRIHQMIQDFKVYLVFMPLALCGSQCPMVRVALAEKEDVLRIFETFHIKNPIVKLVRRTLTSTRTHGMTSTRLGEECLDHPPVQEDRCLNV